MADSDSTADRQRNLKSPLPPCSIHPSTKDHSSCQAAAPQSCPLTASITPPSIAPQGVGGSSAWLWQLQHMLGCPTLCQDLFNYLFITFSFHLSVWACHLVPAGTLPAITALENPENYQAQLNCHHPDPEWDSVLQKNIHAFRFIQNISQIIYKNSPRPCPEPTTILGTCVPCYLQGIKIVNFLFFPGELLLEPYLISPIDLYKCTWPH